MKCIGAIDALGTSVKHQQYLPLSDLRRAGKMPTNASINSNQHHKNVIYIFNYGMSLSGRNCRALTTRELCNQPSNTQNTKKYEKAFACRMDCAFEMNMHVQAESRKKRLSGQTNFPFFLQPQLAVAASSTEQLVAL